MTLRERITQTFLELIAIDGIYPYEEQVITYVESRLTKAGLAWQEDAFRNIIIKIPGRGDAVLLSTHLDIPEPLPVPHYTVQGDIICSDGSGILGADPKTGLAVLIEFAIDCGARDHETHLPVEIVFTRGEETGLLGARALDYEKISARIGLVLDEDGPVTQVVTQAPSFVKIDARFEGKIVHPREPEKGVNALHAACQALMSLPWGYSTPGVTWNVGMFKAGTARNSVPGSCEFAAELRSYDAAKVRAESDRVAHACNHAAESIGARCHIDTQYEFDGYILERSHPLFARLEKTFAAMSIVPNFFSTFGGSDANIFNAHGIHAVPIGSGYYNAHEYTEAANIADMLQIHDFLSRFIAVV